MSTIVPSGPIQSAAQIRRRMLASRVDGGVAAAPSGPAVPALVIRASSFGGYPAEPLAIRSLDPAATLAVYSFGV